MRPQPPTYARTHAPPAAFPRILTLSPPPPTDSYRYVGCALDNSTRLLPQRLGQGPAMTIPKCAALASAKGYSIFGLQVGQGGLYIRRGCASRTAVQTPLRWRKAAENWHSGAGGRQVTLYGAVWRLFRCDFIPSRVAKGATWHM